MKAILFKIFLIILLCDVIGRANYQKALEVKADTDLEIVVVLNNYGFHLDWWQSPNDIDYIRSPFLLFYTN